MIKTNEFRVLELFPHGGDNETPIRCALSVASVTNSPEYEALSYVWGNQSEKQYIDVTDNVDGATRRLAVTETVLIVLRQLRLKDETRKLWIDQLCINQEDAEEKMNQVRLMRQIYSRCTSCTLYMGEIPEGISVADAEAAFAMWRYMAAFGQAAPEERKNISAPPCLASETELRGALKALWATDSRNNSWWSRVWTVQETVLPKKRVLQWGPLRMPWLIIHQSQETWRKAGIPPVLYRGLLKAYDLFHLPRHANILMGETIVMTIWLEITASGSESPLYTVFKWHHRRATEPRDKIIGLLGLCPAGSFPLTKSCDYKTPLSEVFTSMTLDLIAHEKSLKPLAINFRSGCYALRHRAALIPGMPRWAIDLVAGFVSRHPNAYHELHGYGSYSANNGIPLDIDTQTDMAKHIAKTGALGLKGVFVDTVKAVGDPLQGSGELLNQAKSAKNDTLLLKATRSWLRMAEGLVDELNRNAQGERRKYLRDGTLRDAFAQLMLGELVRNEEAWPERRPTAADCQDVLHFIDSGERNGLHYTIACMVIDRAFFVTQTGLIGVGQLDAMPGDEVWVFHGGNVPFIVRRKTNMEGRHYDFVGPSHVRGVMSGEAFREPQNTEEDITIY